MQSAHLLPHTGSMREKTVSQNTSCKTETICIRSQIVRPPSAVTLALEQPVQTYRYRLLACPIQMFCWSLRRLSLLIGACKGITAEGARHHTIFDVEDHICELQTKLSTERWMQRVSPHPHVVRTSVVLDSLHIPSLSSSSQTDDAQQSVFVAKRRVRKRRTHVVKSKICKLIILLSWSSL